MPTNDTPAENRLPLNPQQQRFLVEYLKDFNATQAAIRAGYAESSAKSTGCVLLKHPDIKAHLDKVRHALRETVEQQVRLTSERTQRVMASVAYVDIRGFYREDGTPKAPHELTEEQAAAVQGIDTVETWVGTGDERRKVVTTKVRLVNRMAALDMAARVTGEFAKDNEQRRPARELTEQEIVERMAELTGMELRPRDATLQ